MRLLPAFFASLLFATSVSAADLIHFWDEPQHGGNSFNRLPPDQAYFDALKGYGATWVRLSYDKWKPAKRDFLIGDADKYEGIPAQDLATLKAALDRADKAGLKVVITPLSLPGMRWAQNNGNKFDGRIWQDKMWWAQAAAFWKDLATALKDHPGVAAYNIVNEPAPEKNNGVAEHGGADAMGAWYAQQAGTARDLPAFYDTVIKAIREVDPSTPIMADAGWYAAADAFSYWTKPLADDKVLYSFHMYEPYAATSAPNMKREKPYAYPGKVPFGEAEETWDRDRVAAYLKTAGRLGRQPRRAAQPHGRRGVRLHAPLGGLQDLSRGCADLARRQQAALGVLQFPRRQLGWHGLRAGFEEGPLEILGRYRRWGTGSGQAQAGS